MPCSDPNVIDSDAAVALGVTSEVALGDYSMQRLQERERDGGSSGERSELSPFYNWA